jgi:fatty acid desaturase
MNKDKLNKLDIISAVLFYPALIYLVFWWDWKVIILVIMILGMFMSQESNRIKGYLKHE